MKIGAKNGPISMDIRAESQKQISRQLYFVPALLVRGKAKGIVKQNKQMDGIEVWRCRHVEYG